ncbi:MAG TPA: DUF481 domain-containing protein [Phycisphaeraceae bacterium]|nr:DUF481 domain-containing protein [Phycisphaeraceae bacterium]
MKIKSAIGFSTGCMILMMVCGSAVAQDNNADGNDNVLSQVTSRPSWLNDWTGGVDVGIDGSSGNTDTVNLHIGLNAKHTTDTMETSGSLLFLYAQQSADETQNRFEAKLRNDWLFGADSPWRFFVEGTYEIDEFQDWDSRLSGYAGVGYEFIDNDKTFLLGMIGGGASKAFGAPNGEDDVRPELMLGLDFSHKLTERQKLTAGTQLYPNLDDTGEYRWNTQAAWEILVDPEVNLNLKLGVENRYDSLASGDTKKNDFYYFATLGWTF